MAKPLTHWSMFSRHCLIVIGTFYICIMLTTFYLVAVDQSSTETDVVKKVAAPSTRGDVKCQTACNCTRFDMPRTSEFPEPIIECPRMPPNLVGHLKITSDTTADDVNNQPALDRLTHGGFYKHKNCRAIEKVAIIVPYRNRAPHLEILLYHLHTFLQKQQLDYGIFVVELAFPTQFNRGLLANIGFLTAMTVDNFTCAIIHDVDLLPANDKNLYRCNSKHPRHLSVSNSKYNYKLPYGHYIGGIVALTPEQFRSINGFSNVYFGWGKEDDDLFKRIMHQHYKVIRPAADVGLYEALSHTKERTNPDNVMKDSLLLTNEQRSIKDGINSVLYSRLALEFRPLYTWVYVKVNETLIMKGVDTAIARIPRMKTP